MPIILYLLLWYSASGIGGIVNEIVLSNIRTDNLVIYSKSISFSINEKLVEVKLHT